MISSEENIIKNLCKIEIKAKCTSKWAQFEEIEVIFQIDICKFH